MPPRLRHLPPGAAHHPGQAPGPNEGQLAVPAMLLLREIRHIGSLQCVAISSMALE